MSLLRVGCKKTMASVLGALSHCLVDHSPWNGEWWWGEQPPGPDLRQSCGKGHASERGSLDMTAASNDILKETS